MTGQQVFRDRLRGRVDNYHVSPYVIEGTTVICGVRGDIGYWPDVDMVCFVVSEEHSMQLLYGIVDCIRARFFPGETCGMSIDRWERTVVSVYRSSR